MTTEFLKWSLDVSYYPTHVPYFEKKIVNLLSPISTSKTKKFAFVITTCDGKHTPQICKEYSDIVYHSRQV